MSEKGKLYLVGAGVGDPELITVKAVNILKKAEVVLYDALLSDEVLDYAEKAEKIFVGKRKGMHSSTQDEINQKILAYINQGKTIVRLKGGDPMIFGRAHEELELAYKHDFQVNVIPGISSYSALAASYQLPITKREVSQSFVVITATNLKKELTKELEKNVYSHTTLIIFMGMHLLEEIVTSLLKVHAKDYPIGIFQEIGFEKEQSVVGTLSTILDLKQKHGLSNPALIVVGRSLEDLPSHERFV